MRCLSRGSAYSPLLFLYTKHSNHSSASGWLFNKWRISEQVGGVMSHTSACTRSWVMCGDEWDPVQALVISSPNPGSSPQPVLRRIPTLLPSPHAHLSPLNPDNSGHLAQASRAAWQLQDTLLAKGAFSGKMGHVLGRAAAWCRSSGWDINRECSLCPQAYCPVSGKSSSCTDGNGDGETSPGLQERCR